MNIYLKLSEDIKQDKFIKNIISARENKNISDQNIRDLQGFVNQSKYLENPKRNILIQVKCNFISKEEDLLN